MKSFKEFMTEARKIYTGKDAVTMTAKEQFKLVDKTIKSLNSSISHTKKIKSGVTIYLKPQGPDSMSASEFTGTIEEDLNAAKVAYPAFLMDTGKTKQSDSTGVATEYVNIVWQG